MEQEAKQKSRGMQMERNWVGKPVLPKRGERGDAGGKVQRKMAA